MHNFKFFEEHELTGKTPQQLHRLELIDKAMAIDYEYDDLEALITGQLEQLFKPKPKAEAKLSNEKPVKMGRPRRVIPRNIAEAFEYRNGYLHRVEYIEQGGERWPSVAPHPVDGTMRAQGLVIEWRGQCIALHRLAWFLIHGEWPDGRVIHLDGNKRNNLIENLELERMVSIRETKAGFVAKVRKAGELVELGTYDTRGEAVEAIQFFRDLGVIG